MPEELERVVKQLRNFRLRADAIQTLIDAGEEAIDPILERLPDERSTGAKWAMISVLGEIGNDRVVPELAPCLLEDDFREVTHEALMRITGQDYGDTPDGWVAWYRKQGGETEDTAAAAATTAQGAGAPMQATELPFDEMLQTALQNERATIDAENEDSYSVEILLPDGRKQRVRIAVGKRDHEGSDIAIVYTECGPAEEKLYETVLRKNMQMPYGAIAIRDINQEPCFVMFNTLLREGLTPAGLRKSIMILAERADKIEKVISKGADNY